VDVQITKCLIHYKNNSHPAVLLNSFTFCAPVVFIWFWLFFSCLRRMGGGLACMVLLQSPPWLGWPLWNICVTNYHRYVPLIVNTSRSFPHSWLITGFVTRLKRLVPLVEQELLTLPEHLSLPVFSGVRVTRSLALYVCFVDHCLYFFCWPLCCLFFDLCILITPLVSSNSTSMLSFMHIRIN
jgi:hypothetical protein